MIIKLKLDENNIITQYDYSIEYENLSEQELSQNNYINIDENQLNNIHLGITKYIDGQFYTDQKLANEEIIKSKLRVKRQRVCFPIINRGELWYANLTSEQKSELSKWYQDWLNVTETFIEPTKPSWLK